MARKLELPATTKYNENLARANRHGWRMLNHVYKLGGHSHIKLIRHNKRSGNDFTIYLSLISGLMAPNKPLKN